MKTWNCCEIAFDCVKHANAVLHVGLCKEIFARKHTATHKPTSAQPTIVTTMTHTHIHTHTPIIRLWSPLTYGLGAKIASGAPRPTAQRGNNRLLSSLGLRPDGPIRLLKQRTQAIKTQFAFITGPGPFKYKKFNDFLSSSFSFLCLQT